MVTVLTRLRKRQVQMGWNRRFSHDTIILRADYGRGRQLGPGPVRRCPCTGSAFKKRLVQVATAITAHPQHSLPKACDDWGDLKAAYRFLSNERVTPEAIQAPHRRDTRTRCSGLPLALVLQDTTELDFTNRKQLRGLGPIGNGHGQGLLQHTALAVTPSGAVLGVLHQQWSTRITPPEGETRRERLKRPKKTDCWPETVAAVGESPADTRFIHVCDREADSFEMMQACDDHHCGFLIRAQHDRCVRGRTDKLWSFMAQQPVMGQRRLDLPSRHGQRARTARLHIRCAQVTLDAPKGDPRFRRPRDLWVVYVTEPRPPKNVDPIEWMLLTSEPTNTAEQAALRVDWYACRWIIEEFHKVEKTGCRLERSQLDDAEDIKRLSAIVAVTAVRLLMLRDLARGATQPDAPAQDPAVLQRSVPWLWIVVVAWADKKHRTDPATLTPREFWLRIARQGGYIGRRSDGRPGWSTIWKGWYDFMWMFQGAELMAEGPASPPKCG
jgi:hypothetical protein